MNALTYLLQVNLYLLLFYLFYLVLLHNDTFFRLNRFYLVGSGILSLFIPLLRADWIKELFVTEQVQQLAQIINTSVPQTNNITFTVIKAEEQPLLTATEWFWLIYGIVTLAFLINFLRKLYVLNKVLKKENKGHAFSFFNKISIDSELEGQETIMKHELVHAKQWHSADVIFFELFTAMNWFNPISYLYKNAIKNIHEFIADETAASTLESKSAYALLLVSNVFDTQPQQLTNSFYNQSLLKRRIIMLHKTKSRKTAILKYGLSVPLFAGMVIFSSATGAEAKIAEKFSTGLVPVIEGLKKVRLNTDEGLLKSAGEIVKTAGNIKKPFLVPKSEGIEPDQRIPQKTKAQIEKSNSSNIKSTPAEKLQKYLSDFFNDREQETKVGMTWFSFDVDEQKHADNFKIISSAGFAWEKELLQYLGTFKDTVGLTKGTYSFYQGFDPDEEKTIQSFKDKPTFAFGSSSRVIFNYITADETKKEAGKIVNYIKVDYLQDPVILVDGKEAAYTLTDSGFKLEEKIHPKKANIKIFKGQKAVEQYNESARKGLIVIKTEEGTQ
nr:M56 family metallopeptidase [Pedobacter panaciterrae]